MGSQYVKPYIEPFKYVRNGKYPAAEFQGELADRAAHLALYRLKEIASFGMTTAVLGSPGFDGERVRWRTRYEPSPYAAAIVVRAWLAQATLENTSSDPYAVVDLDGGAEGGTAELHYGAAPVEDANPDHMGALTTFVLESAGVIYVPDPTLVYDVRVSDYQSRIAACTIYEASLATPSPFSEGYAATVPILDIHRQELVEYARTAWKEQAAPLFTWTVDDGLTPRSRSTASDMNLIDNANTSVSGASLGFTIDLRNRSRISTGTVPVRFRAYCSVAAGSGGTVKLKDSGGTTVATISNAGATGAGWYQTTAELPATLAKYDITYQGDGTNALSVYATNLVQFSA